MEWMVSAGQPGKTYLLQGNEAIARGALEAGIRFAAGYPGSPGSEILGMIGRASDRIDLYAEWSTNETCSFQACMGASATGVRSLCVLKQNGLLYIGDALHSAALSGCRGGVVLVTADDPGAHSSSCEFDSRHQARSASIPMLEPSDYMEAKDMVRWAYELSEELQQVVMVRGVTRIHHGRGNVLLDTLPNDPPKPSSWITPIVAVNWFHALQLEKLERARTLFEESSFNSYIGPDNPELIIVSSGIGRFYSEEAIDELGLTAQVGLLKLGTTWPLPENMVLSHLKKTRRVLVVEEVDPFLEQNIGDLVGHQPALNLEILGRMRGSGLPNTGELNPDIVRAALARAMGMPEKQQTETVYQPAVALPPRDLTFCAGCPHRATFFVLKQAIALLGKGLVMGDIGCYTLGGTAAGHFGLQGLSCMGGGINMAEGLGQLARFGFDQPVVALAGDSTFFHSCLPGLVNARYHNANILFMVLDNSATAMTGFQPHPGTGGTCMGEPAEAMSIESMAQAVGCPVTVADPHDPESAIATVYRLMKTPGLKVLVMRHECATLAVRTRGRIKYRVDPNKCRADECGCNYYCSRIWACPGNILDKDSGKALVDEVVCAGCGVCARLCPAGAIIQEGEAV